MKGFTSITGGGVSGDIGGGEESGDLGLKGERVGECQDLFPSSLRLSSASSSLLLLEASSDTR